MITLKMLLENVVIESSYVDVKVWDDEEETYIDIFGFCDEIKLEDIEEEEKKYLDYKVSYIESLVYDNFKTLMNIEIVRGE